MSNRTLNETEFSECIKLNEKKSLKINVHNLEDSKVASV